jgi:cytochrome c553
LAFGLAAVSAWALPAAGQGGDLAEKIQLCSACHGDDGNSKIEKMPSLAGQPAFFILNQLFLMREGVRKVEAMAPIVKDLKDEHLDGLSKHFSSLPASAAMSRSMPRWSSVAPRSPGSGAAAPAICRTFPAASRCRGWPSSASTT